MGLFFVASKGTDSLAVCDSYEVQVLKLMRMFSFARSYEIKALRESEKIINHKLTVVFDTMFKSYENDALGNIALLQSTNEKD